MGGVSPGNQIVIDRVLLAVPVSWTTYHPLTFSADVVTLLSSHEHFDMRLEVLLRNGTKLSLDCRPSNSHYTADIQSACDAGGNEVVDYYTTWMEL